MIVPTKIALTIAAIIGVAGYLVADNFAPFDRDVVVGQPRVIDGDTLEIDGLSIRLEGLDAPELGTDAGVIAARTLQALVGNDAITCRLTGEVSYDREIAICFLDGRDIAAELVAAGVALDCPRYSGGRYAPLERRGSREDLDPAGYCQ